MTLVIPCPGSVQYANITPVVPIVPPAAGETPGAPPPTGAPVAPTAIPPRADATVNLQDGTINPTPIEIKAGQSVLWANQSQNTYTLLSGIPGQPNEFFASPPLPPGGFYVFKFDAAGNYSYYVNENPMMVGQVNVTP
jgi:plastocyanin